MCFYNKAWETNWSQCESPLSNVLKKERKKKKKCKGQEQKKKKQPPKELTLSNFEPESIIYLQTYHYFPRETCLSQWDENQAVLSGRVVFLRI